MKPVLRGHMTGGFNLSNLKNIRKAEGLTQEHVARDLEVSLNTYRNWEQEKNNPSPENLSMLAAYFNCTVDDLIVVGSEPASGKYKMIEIPVLREIPVGVSIESLMKDTDRHERIPMELYDQYSYCFLLEVKGNSMNLILPDGALALIDYSKANEAIVSGHVYALNINGYEATIKRIEVLDNGFRLLPYSTDPTYKPQVFDYGVEGTDEIMIIGEVVWYTVPFNFIKNFEYAVVRFD